MSVIERPGAAVEHRTGRSWCDLVAQFTPRQVDAVEASVAEAGEFTSGQIYALSPLFAGAGERIANSRTAGRHARGAA